MNRWSTERATKWYQAQPWLVGCNFIPSNAINQLEMWQTDTFDPATIDRELGWAEKIGKQPEPLPGVHNSGWLESPGLPQLERYPNAAALRQRLEHYVKTMTMHPWSSWKTPGGNREPAVWHHEIFRQDGTPYDPEEPAFIREIMS